MPNAIVQQQFETDYRCLFLAELPIGREFDSHFRDFFIFMKTLVFVKDLFFRAKIESELKRIKADFEFVNSVSGRDFDYLILDLEEERSFEITEKFKGKCICFCSHGKADLIKKAKSLGCKVYPRSVFFENLEKMLKG